LSHVGFWVRLAASIRVGVSQLVVHHLAAHTDTFGGGKASLAGSGRISLQWRYPGRKRIASSGLALHYWIERGLREWRGFDHPDFWKLCHSQITARTSNDPTSAATTSRSEIATLSSPGKIPNTRNTRPPTRAPTRPTPRLRRMPKPLRSRVINSPARLPPSRPIIIQTMTARRRSAASAPPARGLARLRLLRGGHLSGPVPQQLKP
jgi:hypothetical protein